MLGFVLAAPRGANAACNVIPAAQTIFRGTLGSASQPFATPGDWLGVSLDSRCDGEASPGFTGANHVVTVVFTPPSGPRNVVALARDCATLEASRAACEARDEVARAVCIQVNGPGQPRAIKRVDGRRLEFRFPDTDAVLRACTGGSEPGRACLLDTDCPGGGSCAAGIDDDLTLAGPASIAVTRATEPIPCDVATSGCTRRLGLLACIDQLFAADGTCEPTSGKPFVGFTALPPPNDYTAICTDPIPPCDPKVDRDVRFAIDSGGNMLVPMDWRGVLVTDDAVPVARILRGRTNLEAFAGRGAPILIPDSPVVASFAPNGVRVAPIFDPQVDPTDTAGTTFFGTADAPQTVLRVARHDVVTGQCAGGPGNGLPCIVPGDCPGGACGPSTCFVAGQPTPSPCTSDSMCASGECGPGLFDFSTRLAAGVGPVLATTASVVALDPVPLDGLTQSAEVNALLSEEAITRADLNDDGDATDHVVKLTDRDTGVVETLQGDLGRAVARVREGRFSFPALAASGRNIAFLEPESAQGHVDRSGNGQVFEQLLRLFRATSPSAPAFPRATNLLAGRKVVADAIPAVDGRSLVFSGGQLFFHASEDGAVPREMIRVSVASDGAEAGASAVGSSVGAISADGRFVAFSSDAENLVPDDTNELTDVFVHDRMTGETSRVSVSSAGEQAMTGPANVGTAISADGRFVAFSSSASDLVSGDTNGRSDVFVHDRTTAETTRVSVSSNGDQTQVSAAGSFAAGISADGRFVSISSDADNLVLNDTNGMNDVFVRDRTTGTTTRVSVSSNGAQGNSFSFGGLLSADGRFVTFFSLADNLVPGDTNLSPDLFVRDRASGETTRVSVSSSGEQGNGASGFGAISADGRFVVFQSSASNLVPGDTNGVTDVFVHDRVTRTTARVSVSSSGEQADAGSLANTAISADGRFISFASQADNLVPGDTNFDPDDPGALNNGNDVFLHDRLTGETTRVNVSSSGEQSNGVAGLITLISADGRFVVFRSSADNLVTSDGNGSPDVFVRGPEIAAAAQSTGDLTGDGSADDLVLSAVEVSSGQVRTLCPSTQAATAAGRVAFLRPEWAGIAPEPGVCPAAMLVGGNPDLNGDGDATDAVVQLWSGSGAVENLMLAATDVALSRRWIAALASEAGQGSTALNGDMDADDTVAFVRSLQGGSWINLGHAASAIAVERAIVAFIVPEEADGRGSLNGDVDTDDQVLDVYDADSEDLIELGQEAEDFVVGPTGLVAFRTSEAKQGGQMLNGDDDAADDVLQLFVPGSTAAINTRMAVRPCRLEACDPHVPYRVLSDTVKFLTLECDQGGPVTRGCPSGGTDLDGDGRADHLVLQVLNVPQALATLALRRARAAALGTAEAAASAQQVEAESMAESTHILAAARTGLCTTTGKACTDDADCSGDVGAESGTCFVPPGGCVRDLGTTCDPRRERPDPTACPEGQFCVPSGMPGEGTCSTVEKTCLGGPIAGEVCGTDQDCGGGECTERCAGTADCRAGAECNDAAQSFQRLVDPLMASEDAPGAAVLIGGGRCVEDLVKPCAVARDCGAGEFCSGGTCRREQGLCRSCKADDAACTACPAGSTCEQDLLVNTAPDSDGDELPDPIDDCPVVANVTQEDLDGDGIGDACDRQTCGNAVLEPGETCDDGNAIPDDGCSCTLLCDPANGGAIASAQVKMRRLSGPLGNERLTLTGGIRLPHDQSSASLGSLIAGGVQLLVEDLGRDSREIFDLTRRASPVPGPAQPGACDAGLDFWTVAIDGLSAVYRNQSGRLPVGGCVPGSALGLRRIELSDDRSTTGTIGIHATVRGGSLERPVGPLRVTIVLGTTDADSAGRCGSVNFTPAQCISADGGRQYVCDGR